MTENKANYGSPKEQKPKDEGFRELTMEELNEITGG